MAVWLLWKFWGWVRGRLVAAAKALHPGPGDDGDD